jgi:hypothetical protein
MNWKRCREKLIVTYSRLKELRRSTTNRNQDSWWASSQSHFKSPDFKTEANFALSLHSHECSIEAYRSNNRNTIIIIIIIIIIKKIHFYYTIKEMDNWVICRMNSTPVMIPRYFQDDGIYFKTSWDVLYYIRMFRILWEGNTNGTEMEWWRKPVSFQVT